MKIAFPAMGWPHISSIGYLSAILKNGGHEVRLFHDPALFDDKQIIQAPGVARFFDINQHVADSILEYGPDLVAFSTMSNNYLWAVRTATALKKKRNIPVIFGGIHPTSVPDVVIQEPSIDMVNVGEGFDSLLELADRMDAGRDHTDIRNIWLKRNGKVIKNELRPLYEDLDSLPFPDIGLFKDCINVQKSFKFITSMGCPFSCTYCCATILRGLYGKKLLIRRRSPESVVQELRQARERHGLKKVNLQDDIFTLDEDWLVRFTELYKKEVGLPYRINSHFRYVNEGIVQNLKESGCTRIEFGVQTANDRLRHTILKRPETNREIEKALNLCDEYGIEYQLDTIFNIPGETLEHVEQAALFYSRFKPARVSTFWLVYFPRTKIVETARERGILNDQDIRDLEKGHIRAFHIEPGKKSDEKQRLISRTYLLFLLIPLLPRRINRWLAESGAYKKFPVVPFPVKLILELMIAFKYQDYEKTDHLKRYFKNISTVARIKLGRWLR